VSPCPRVRAFPCRRNLFVSSCPTSCPYPLPCRSSPSSSSQHSQRIDSINIPPSSTRVLLIAPKSQSQKKKKSTQQQKTSVGCLYILASKVSDCIPVCLVVSSRDITRDQVDPRLDYYDRIDPAALWRLKRQKQAQSSREIGVPQESFPRSYSLFKTQRSTYFPSRQWAAATTKLCLAGSHNPKTKAVFYQLADPKDSAAFVLAVLLALCVDLLWLSASESHLESYYCSSLGYCLLRLGPGVAQP